MSKKPAVVEPPPQPVVDVGNPGQSVSLTLEITAAFDATPALGKPNLRFKWLNGDRVTTTAIGEAPDWKPASTAASTGAFTFVKEWPSVQFHELLCKGLNSNPHVFVFVGDAPAADPGSAGHPWLSHAVLDVSALLDGDVAIAVETGTGTSCVAPSPLSFLSIRLTASKPALTDELRMLLNPLAVSINKLTNLPGVVLPDGVDPSMRKFVSPDKFALLGRVCAPVFACYRLFDGDDQPRVVRTPCISQSAGGSWSAKSVFLLGTFAEADVQQHFLTSPLRVEVHDRARVCDVARPGMKLLVLYPCFVCRFRKRDSCTRAC